jgi:hypothetical protein
MRSIRVVSKARWRCSGQLRPALADFPGTRDQPSLRWRVGKPYRLIDAAGVEKPLSRSAGHEMLDLPRWNAQGGGAFALILGDQWAGDIVAVARALFDCIARRHPVALGIKQHPGEQARLVSACAGVALGGIAGEPHLNRIPQQLVDDWRVFAGMGLSLVNDFAAIGAVLQYQVECAGENGLPPITRPAALVHDLLFRPRASSSAFNNRTEPSSA